MFTIVYPDVNFGKFTVEREVAGPDATVLYAPDAWDSADAIVASGVLIDRRAIKYLKRVRIVVRLGVGYEAIDLEACGEAGIPVCNVPDYGTTEVADTAIAMMLTFARGTAALNAALRADLASGWTHVHNVTARRLRGERFGVVGLGRIGAAAGLRAQAFGMDVAFYSPRAPSGAELAVGFARTRTLRELLESSDVVSLHAPLTNETRGLIDAGAVATMKPGSYLINTARGPICDTAALLAGLKSGKLAAAGLDVLPGEPASPADPLVAAWQANEPWIRGRVLINPHAGFYSREALRDLRRKAIETAYCYLRDGKLTNCVNAGFLKNTR